MHQSGASDRAHRSAASSSAGAPHSSRRGSSVGAASSLSAPSSWAPSSWAPSSWAPSSWAPSSWAPGRRNSQRIPTVRGSQATRSLAAVTLRPTGRVSGGTGWSAQGDSWPCRS
ncbi:MAG: hypothetical protein D6798_03295 [Deltaproteobacteria bacterium]|nr:MAG: hypothetical protein D6798_03295 [Deltaproteobacteria bacterium]